MRKQYVLDEEEYEEIKAKLNEYEGIVESLNSYNGLVKNHEYLIDLVKKIFDVREDGYISHYITTANYPNKLFIQTEALRGAN